MFDASRDKIKEYNIRYRERAEDTWKASIVKVEKKVDERIEGKIENLSPKTTYDVCVVAILKDGSSETSKEIKVTTAIEGISSEINPLITSVDKTSCIVKWDSFHSEISNYKVVHDSGSLGSSWKEVKGEVSKQNKKGTDSMKMKIEGLSPGTNYQVKVIALSDKNEETPSKSVR